MLGKALPLVYKKKHILHILNLLAKLKKRKSSLFVFMFSLALMLSLS